MAKDTKEVAVKNEALSYGDDAGSGFEGTTAKDMSIPFLNILQANSPQVQEEDPPGSKSGMLFNTVTREIYTGSEGVIFLPCYKDGPVWVEWIPRDMGGGFVGIHQPEDSIVLQAEPIPHPKTGKPTRRLQAGDNELIETFHAYGLTLEELKSDDTGDTTTMTTGFAVINFTSTKIKPYRDFITAMMWLRGKPPIFANRARITTAIEKRDGQSYFNFRINPWRRTWMESLINPKTEADMLTEAKTLRKMVTDGVARAAYETTAEDSGGSESGAPEGGNPPF